MFEAFQETLGTIVHLFVLPPTLVITRSLLLESVGNMKKRKSGRVVMGTFLRYKPVDELRHWRYGDGCGRRFSRLVMVWIDRRGRLCVHCQRRI